MGISANNRPVGVVGNDRLGVAVAERFASCHLPTRYAALLGSPAVVFGGHLSPMELSSKAEPDCAVVLAAIEDTETFRNLLLGTNAAGRLALKTGSVIVDLGARTPRELDALLTILEPLDVALVDATLLGGAESTAQGHAKVLLGGAERGVEIAESVLSLLGQVERTGPLGSAHAAAALMGYIEAAHAVAREEAVALGAACGLTPDMIARVLSERVPPHGLNVVQLARRADLARRIARDRIGGADIIDLAAEKNARAQRENR
ncbi:NAD(P)-binding domain-containing protein [Hyphomicrobium sp.]|uniref:NAD(P)-binding domain-containing protein n=1 Tax=Hyphomicrobium sp. TaxID=82 RepID=UPI000FAFB7F0|nr:NAD(P)-binding domain-containing protein [Hyphomicrobium sp.]RUO99386.1 MAG: NAD(P)-dependent oxidoreductase [Hyphomicrobium sp.]